MCRPVQCRNCGKTTWAGCGNHVEDVMRNVATSQRCRCDRSAPQPKAEATSWLGKLFGR